MQCGESNITGVQLPAVRYHTRYGRNDCQDSSQKHDRLRRSKRKTSSQVAFVNGDRLLGEEAAVLQPRFPDRVFASVRDQALPLKWQHPTGSEHIAVVQC